MFSAFFASVCVSKTRPARGGFFVACFLSAANHAGVNAEEPDEPVAIPITGELDLHTFRPGEISSLLDDYLAECRRRRIHRVRVVHGKGTGALRATVHAHLRRSPLVAGLRKAMRPQAVGARPSLHSNAIIPAEAARLSCDHPGPFPTYELNARS